MFIFIGKLALTTALQLGVGMVAGDNQILLSTGNLCAKILGHIFFHKAPKTSDSTELESSSDQSSTTDTSSTEDLTSQSYLEIQAQANYFQDELTRRNTEIAQRAENILGNTQVHEQLTAEILNSSAATVPTMEGFMDFLGQINTNVSDSS